MLFPVFALLVCPSLPQDTAPEPWWDAEVEASLARAGERREAWTAEALGVPAEAREGFAYLLAHMPQRDLDALEPAFVTENVTLALRARAATPWGAALPDDVFLDSVLPYAHVSEPRDAWRAEFLERFLPAVADCETPGEAAQRLNGLVFGELGVRYSTKRERADQSPRESIEQGLASCTGLSILLADACRAVGVPARLAGVASWVDKGGNHTWVEVWDDGWHFTGAAEPDGRGLDHAWFQADAARARPGDPRHGVWAVSWRPTGEIFPLVFAPDVVSNGVDVSARYVLPLPADAGAARLMLDVLEGEQRVAAEVRARVVGSDLVSSATSRDESHDTNDVIVFELAAGSEVELDVSVDGTWVPRGRQRLPEGATRLTLALPDAAEVGTARREQAWARYRALDHAALRTDFDARVVRTTDREAPYRLRVVGERPPGGFGLVIAMHGGGGVPPEVNDRQWRVMERYYKDHPEHGGYLYCALRAPNDVWNGFYDDAIAPLVEVLVRQALLFGDVDPDRVHLIGYSHGGYGAFTIGTKIPYRFATVHASAAAPHGGETVGENLCATRFSYMVGERDTAYGRRERCEEFDALIATLRGDREDIFPVEFLYQPGHGHGGLPDRDILSTQLERRREPAPPEVRWLLTDDALGDFFWLATDAPRDGGRVVARCHDNRVELQVERLESLTVWLDERLVDLARPVTLIVNGAEHAVEVTPDPTALDERLRRVGDPRLAFCARVEVPLGDG